MKVKYILILISALLVHYGGLAQISATDTNADYVGVRYNPNGDSTLIFTYYASTHKQMKLTAHGFGDTVANFKWHRFDNLTKTIDPVPFSNTVNSSVSEVAISGEGGYMLAIDNGQIVDTFRAWVFYDIIDIDSVSNIQNCDFLQLTVYPSANRSNFGAYDYFDFCDLNQVVQTYINNEYTVEWNAEKDIYAGINLPQSWKHVVGSANTRISPAPFVESAYSVKIRNIFGQVSREFKTSPILASGVYATFEVLIPDEFDVFKPATTLEGQALWRMKLNNKSVNADKFEWIGLNNQLINFLKNDTLWRYDTENIFDEIVYKPGEYPVKLTVENTRTGCRHSAYSQDASGKRKDIKVYESRFSSESFPNAFTPNGDGRNDIFTFVQGGKPVSMRFMEIKIVNRNGLLVYKYSGEVSSWEGWNGKMNGNGSECSTGVYYYVVNGDGWDDKSYSGKPYTGVIHLFR